MNNRQGQVSLLVAAVILLTVAAPRPSRACGGFYGSGVEVSPSQTIVVVHRNGVETYIFRPHFCGTAKDFGVILPIPSPLTVGPTIADNAVFDHLETFTAPRIEEVCLPNSWWPELWGGSMSGTGGGIPTQTRSTDTDVNVIDRGRVGDFDFVLLQATTVEAFTDWLDQNGFPRTERVDAYQHYVDKGWYFVAFKVSASPDAPPAGRKMCGDLGPIQLSFATSHPVVPARIASVNTFNKPSPNWRIIFVAANQQEMPSPSRFSNSLHFSKAFTLTDLTLYPSLLAIARPGERLTALNVWFPDADLSDDIETLDSASSEDYWLTNTVYKDCGGGCSTAGGAGGDLLPPLVFAGILAVLQRMARRPARSAAPSGAPTKGTAGQER